MAAQKAENEDGASTLHDDEHHDIKEDQADGVKPTDTSKDGNETKPAPAPGSPAVNADTDDAPAPDSTSTTENGNEATRPNAPRPCPSATTNAPAHEERIAGLQRELADLRAQVQKPAKSTFQIVERLQELRTQVRQTDAQADSKEAKASILSLVGDDRTEKLIAIRLEAEDLLRACAQAWELLPAISPLTHEAGDTQSVLDQQRALTQGSRSILEYVRVATTLRQKGFAHRFLAAIRLLMGPPRDWNLSERIPFNSNGQIQ